jgi:hypothetical protein
MKANERAQKQYDIIMLQIREIMFHDNGGLQSVVEQLQTVKGGPVRAIGYTAAMLVKSVKSGLAEKGKKVDPEILKAAFLETVANLVEVAIAAKIIPPDQKQQVAQQAAADGAQIFKQSAAAPKGAPPQPASMQQPPQGVAPAGIVQQELGAPQ